MLTAEAALQLVICNVIAGDVINKKKDNDTYLVSKTAVDASVEQNACNFFAFQSSCNV
jgi:hypothetical protein